jgi:hypothetical protein
MRDLQPDGQWPLWSAPGEIGETDAGGYGGVACYVTPRLAEAYLPRGHRDLLSRKAAPGPALDRQLVEALWHDLVRQNLVYAEPPWNPSDGQIIRDPDWLLRRDDRGAGTCVDLSLLFAAQCLNEKLDTLLLMLRGPRAGHVAVAIRLGSSAADNRDEARRRGARPTLPVGVDPTGTGGVTWIYDAGEFISDETILLIDATAASRDGADRTLGAATALALDALANDEYTAAHLVDVAVRQHGYDDKPLRAPERRVSLRGRIAPLSRVRAPFEAHEHATATVRARTGKIVVTGPQGTGKSTLAREAAAAAIGGFGWFLPASSRNAFDVALAEHELVERGEPVRELDAADREALARDALERLRRTADSWVIVLDNANVGAAEFDAARYAIDRLPAPRDGQLIIATSTAGPDAWPGWAPALLPPVPDDQLAKLGDEEAARLSAGRPLLWAAFRRLLEFAAAVRAELAAGHNPELSSEADDESARRAAARYWDTARRHLGTASVTVARRLAWLPPDRLEPGVAGDDPAVVAELTAAGLLTDSAALGACAMHRLLSEAIRAAAAAEGRAQETVRDLLARPETRTSLLRHADIDVTAELASALAGTRSGISLWALGTLQEVYGGTSSAKTFAQARALLDPPASQEEKWALADCLHASARVANQAKDPSKEMIETGIAEALRAIELRGPAEDSDDAEKTRQVAIAKHEAILALLRQRGVRFIDDRTEKVRVLHEVLDMLEQSWRRRLEALGDGDPLVDRAYYNLAGARMSLAKLDPPNAEALMAGAKEVYETTRDFRRRYYNGPNPITAASVNGIGIWGLESIRLGLAADPDRVLAEAIDAAAEALSMRRQSGIANDIEKSATLLAKLAVQQVKHSTGTPAKPAGQADTTVAEIIGDLGLLVPVLTKLKVTTKQMHTLGLE